MWFFKAFSMVLFHPLRLASYALGFCIYASKVPERFAPGYFDYLLASHQLWHVMVVTGAIIWYAYPYFTHSVCADRCWWWYPVLCIHGALVYPCYVSRCQVSFLLIV